MAQKVSINNFADAVMDALEEYVEMTTEDFEEIAREVAKEGSKKLKQTSPDGAGSGGKKGRSK